MLHAYVAERFQITICKYFYWYFFVNLTPGFHDTGQIILKYSHKMQTGLTVGKNRSTSKSWYLRFGYCLRCYLQILKRPSTGNSRYFISGTCLYVPLNVGTKLKMANHCTQSSQQESCVDYPSQQLLVHKSWTNKCSCKILHGKQKCSDFA